MAQVTLNKNSWHFKYYELVVDNTPPKSLCPYFWTMVLLIILSPIIGIVFLSIKISKLFSNFITSLIKPFGTKKVETFEEKLERYCKEEENATRKRLFWDKASKIIEWVCKFILLPIVCIIVIGGLIFAGVEIGWLLLLLQLVISMIIAGLLITFLIFIDEIGGFFGKILKPLNPLNWKVTIIIYEMIKTTYTKACPLITWKGDETV